MDIKQQRDQLVSVLTAAKARMAPPGIDDTVERDVDGEELARSTRGRDAYHDGVQHIRHAIACLDAALAAGVVP